MTRIGSYKLVQCSSCGQRHILSNIGSVNLMIGGWPYMPKAEDLMVCQRCSAQKPLKDFIPLRTLYPPKSDPTPKWFMPIRKFFDKSYKGPEQHPARLYPRLETTPFNPDTWMPEWARKRMRPEDFPDWHKELMEFRVDKN